MKRILIIIICFSFIFSLASCGKNASNSTITNNPSTDEPSSTIPSTDTNPTTIEPNKDNPYMNKTIEFKIGNTIVDVNWLDNDSVKALKELVKDGLAIDMSMYSNFEKIGSLGKTIASNDETLTTSAGDICLYQSNQIVLFYGFNTWSYTRLGHINLSKSELTELPGEKDVTITLTLK